MIEDYQSIKGIIIIIIIIIHFNPALYSKVCQYWIGKVAWL